MMGGMGNQPPAGPGQGGAGGQDTQWQTDVFRHSLIRKLEEAIKDSGSQSDRNAVDLERCGALVISIHDPNHLVLFPGKCSRRQHLKRNT